MPRGRTAREPAAFAAERGEGSRRGTRGGYGRCSILSDRGAAALSQWVRWAGARGAGPRAVAPRPSAGGQCVADDQREVRARRVAAPAGPSGPAGSGGRRREPHSAVRGVGDQEALGGHRHVLRLAELSRGGQPAISPASGVPVPATVKMLVVAAGAAGAHSSNPAAEASRARDIHRRPRPAFPADVSASSACGAQLGPARPRGRRIRNQSSSRVPDGPDGRRARRWRWRRDRLRWWPRAAADSGPPARGRGSGLCWRRPARARAPGRACAGRARPEARQPRRRLPRSGA
jgi:hypothetical protein